jgi:hypothetical protein
MDRALTQMIHPGAHLLFGNDPDSRIGAGDQNNEETN